MFTRRKLLKVLIKSIFRDGCRSRECVGSKSDKVSDEAMLFEDDGLYYHIRLSVYKSQGGE